MSEIPQHRDPAARRSLSGLRKRWFLIALAVLIPLGMGLGARIPWTQVADGASRVLPGIESAVAMLPRITTALVLFLMAFSLDSRQLAAAFRAPGPVVWASVVNFGFVPLAAWALMPLQRPDDFAVGLMIAGSVPCTLAAASVWTRKAGGNDAVSLLVTLLTNGLCFAVTPFWLKVATGSTVEFDAWGMVVRLMAAVLVPSLVGQVLRQFPRPARFAAAWKTPIGVVAQALILVIVFLASCKAGAQLGGIAAPPGLLSIAGVWATCIALHVAAMAVAAGGARVLGFARHDLIAVAIAASQKTLPIGVLLATDPTMFGRPELGLPFVVFPMLMYHASQLFIDTAVADRFAAAAGR